MARKLTTNEVINRFKEINGDKYDYSEFVYVNAKTKGKIICHKHGEFWQSSNVHLKGVQCPKCVKEHPHKTNKLTNDDVIRRGNKIHNNKYEYDLTNFKNNNSIIDIKCPIHGWFKQRVRNHLNKQGCPKCGNIAKRMKMAVSYQEFIERANKKHNNKFNYSKLEYNNNKDYITIECPIHGEFRQKVGEHLNGKGCPKCIGRGKTIDDFITEAKLIHGDKYDYSKSEYKTSEIKILIKCNQCGHEFWQKPWSHLQNHGCPVCKQSKLEIEIEQLLKENNIVFEPQKRFKWLGKQSLDFYLPDYNIAIECQGEQHFEGSKCFGKKEIEMVIINRDINKYNLSKENGVRVLYFANKTNLLPIEYIGELYIDKNQLLNDIIKQ